MRSFSRRAASRRLRAEGEERKASYAQDIGRSTLGVETHRGVARPWAGAGRRRPRPPAPVSAGRHRPTRSAPATGVQGHRVESIGSVGRRGLPSGPGGVSALDWIRTNDTRFRRAVLYPLSYEGLEGRLPADAPPMTTRATGWRRGERRRARRGGWGLRPGPTGWRCARCAAPPLAWCVGATSTGQDAWDRTAWLVEPSRRPEKPRATRADDDEVHGGGELGQELGRVAGPGRDGAL